VVLHRQRKGEGEKGEANLPFFDKKRGGAGTEKKGVLKINTAITNIYGKN